MSPARSVREAASVERRTSPALHLVVASSAPLRVAFREAFRAIAREAVASRGRFALAIPGGSVVTTLLASLAAGDAEWARTDVFWCDERDVAPTDPDSNFGASMSAWLGPLVDTGIRLHRMGDGDDANASHSLAAAARRYEDDLRATLGDPPVLDLAVVGVGEDGHICSLFPGLPALEETGRWVVAVEDAPKLPRRRLTLTLPAVTSARTLIVAGFGQAKRDVVRSALEDPESTLPVARAIRAAGNVYLFLDDGAASALTNGRRASGT